MKNILRSFSLCLFVVLLSKTAFCQDRPKDKPEVQPNIVNGTATTIDQQPWQVYLSTGCGGSIIGPNTVLTTAHCVYAFSASQVTVYAGISFLSQQSNGQTRSVSNISIHPNYTGAYGSTLDGDVAVLELSSPLTFNTNVQPIRYDGGTNIAPPGTVATASGWGSLSEGGSQPDQLQWANLSIVANSSLQQNQYSYSITNDMIAAGNSSTGICNGDSGG